MGFFTVRRHALDRGVRDSWQASATSEGLTPSRVLAWEQTADDQYCIASVGLLSISSAADGALAWKHIGWHRIERGGYDRDTSTLRWQLYDTGLGSRSGQVRLKDPGRLPEIFRDRVAASIAFQQFIALEADEDSTDSAPGVIVSGRRDLARADAPLEWRVSLPQGLDRDVPGLQELAETALIRVRDEYDPRP